jgi:hypothetical protein
MNEHSIKSWVDVAVPYRDLVAMVDSVQLIMGLVACQYAHYEVHGVTETKVQGHIEMKLGELEAILQTLSASSGVEDLPF